MELFHHLLRIIIMSYLKPYSYVQIIYITMELYLSLPPTRQDLTQGQKPEDQLKWG